MEHLYAPDDVYLPATGQHHKRGELVEVDDDTAASLKEQGWVSARSVAAKRAAARRTHEDGSEVNEDEPVAESAPPVEDADMSAEGEE